MTYRIVPVAPEHIASFRETSDAVFKESQMFAFLEAPPIEHVAEFVLGVIQNNDLQFVAVSGDAVIGWCDVLRQPRPALRHCGVLGLGVLSPYRGQGIGKALLGTTLNAAKERGLTRIELFVRTDNDRAIKLYEKFGFVVEGVLRQHMLVGGVHRDSYLMSVLYG